MLNAQLDYVRALLKEVRRKNGTPLDFDAMICRADEPKNASGDASGRIVLENRNVVALELPSFATGCLNEALVASLATALPSLQCLEMKQHDLSGRTDISCWFAEGGLPAGLVWLGFQAPPRRNTEGLVATISSFAGLPRGLRVLDLENVVLSSPSEGRALPLKDLPPRLVHLWLRQDLLSDGSERVRLVGDLSADNAWCMFLNSEESLGIDCVRTSMKHIVVHIACSPADLPSAVDGERFVQLVRQLRGRPVGGRHRVQFAHAEAGRFTLVDRWRSIDVGARGEVTCQHTANATAYSKETFSGACPDFDVHFLLQQLPNRFCSLGFLLDNRNNTARAGDCAIGGIELGGCHRTDGCFGVGVMLNRETSCMQMMLLHSDTVRQQADLPGRQVVEDAPHHRIVLSMYVYDEPSAAAAASAAASATQPLEPGAARSTGKKRVRFEADGVPLQPDAKLRDFHFHPDKLYRVGVSLVSEGSKGIFACGPDGKKRLDELAQQARLRAAALLPATEKDSRLCAAESSARTAEGRMIALEKQLAALREAMELDRVRFRRLDFLEAVVLLLREDAQWRELLEGEEILDRNSFLEQKLAERPLDSRAAKALMKRVNDAESENAMLRSEVLLLRSRGPGALSLTRADTAIKGGRAGGLMRADSLASVRSAGSRAPAARTTTADVFRDATTGHRCVNDYLLLQQCGAGSQGTVWWSVDKRTNDSRAIKVLPRPVCQDGGGSGAKAVRAMQKSLEATRRLAIEVKALSLCRHRSVVQLFDFIDDPNLDEVFLVMEYVEHGALLRCENDGRADRSFSIGTFLSCARQIISGLTYLHARDIAHGDIRGENVLFDDADCRVLIADFGASHIDQPQELQRTSSAALRVTAVGGCQQQPGSTFFKAPEILDGTTDATSAAADVWSTGLLFYVMLYGELPFPCTSAAEYIEKICSSPFELPLHTAVIGRTGEPELVPRSIRIILSCMLHRDPAFRAKVTDVRAAFKEVMRQREELELHPPRAEAANAGIMTEMTTLPKDESSRRDEEDDSYEDEDAPYPFEKQ